MLSDILSMLGSVHKYLGGGAGKLGGGSKKFKVHWKGGQKSLGYVGRGGSKKLKVKLKVKGKARGGSKKFSRTKIEIFPAPHQGIYERSLKGVEGRNCSLCFRTIGSYFRLRGGNRDFAFFCV